MKTIAPNEESYQLQQVITESIIPCRILASNYGIEMEVIDDLASLITVKGDLKVQKQLIQLILNNTIRHSKASKIIFTTKQLLQSDKEMLIEFSLTDNGAVPKLCSKTFVYFRTLIRAKRIVEYLNGKAELIAVPGLSSTLKIIIKYHWQDAAAITPQNSKALNHSGKNILVAEDNEVNQKVISKILEKNNMQADFAGNGKEAIDLFEKNSDAYDLILMDLQMPYMDGFQTANYIRKKLCNSIPIIALTVGSAHLNYAKCIEAGMNHFIKKPFSERDLLAAIESFSKVQYQKAG
ncbi:MAG: response regulator [Flavisolibacter sp.]